MITTTAAMLMQRLRGCECYAKAKGTGVLRSGLEVRRRCGDGANRLFVSIR